MDIGIDSRKERILQAVIQSYIFTGNPVGSRTVADSCGLRVSAATIRNEMAMLERLGLLTQPHTSAGRVPTDIAYRYYVDSSWVKRGLLQRTRRRLSGSSRRGRGRSRD